MSDLIAFIDACPYVCFGLWLFLMALAAAIGRRGCRCDSEDDGS